MFVVLLLLHHAVLHLDVSLRGGVASNDLSNDLVSNILEDAPLGLDSQITTNVHAYYK